MYLVTVVFNLTSTQFAYRLFASLSDSYEFLGEFKPSGNISWRHVLINYLWVICPTYGDLWKSSIISPYFKIAITFCVKSYILMDLSSYSSYQKQWNTRLDCIKIVADYQLETKFKQVSSTWGRLLKCLSQLVTVTVST